MKTIRKSLIIFFDKSGKLLIQDRREINKQGKPYGFFGGSIEKSETPEKAIVREVQEELSIDLDYFKLVKELNDKNNELDLKYYIYLAHIPNKDKINVREGKLYFTNINDVLSLDLSDRDKSILKDVLPYIKVF
ncbi:MAG: NUDIX domain-containing protein [Nanoarchaeota archaeon]